jgi:hypothetical protein
MQSHCFLGVGVGVGIHCEEGQGWSSWFVPQQLLVPQRHAGPSVPQQAPSELVQGRVGSS